jgi:glycosyltransferase involved in cell wall biosynthesis
MKVTVIVLTYNHEKYIAEALNSVLMQETSFKSDTVVIEDCSTDCTRDIVLDFQGRFPDKVRLLLSEHNKDAFPAFLRAVESAQGKYVALLDGDDYWTSPHKLQKQVDYLDSHPECTLCHHDVIELYEGGRLEPHRHHSPDQKEISTLDDLWEMNFIATCSAMLRRDPVNNLPKWFMNLPWGDWGLFALAARKGNIGYVSEVMGVHRVHDAGLWSGLNNIQRHEQVIKFYKVMDKGLELAYHEKIRVRLAHEYYYLALEYERKGDLVHASKCAVGSLVEDPHCRRVPRRDVHRAITRIHKAILKLHAPALYHMLAAIRKVLSHRDLSQSGTEGSVLSGKHDTHLSPSEHLNEQK